MGNKKRSRINRVDEHRKRSFSIVSDDRDTKGIYRKHGMAGALGIVAAMAFIMYGLFVFNVFVIDYEMSGVTGFNPIPPLQCDQQLSCTDCIAVDCGWDINVNMCVDAPPEPVPDIKTENCDFGPICGDDIIESPEVCDNGNLGGQTCELQGKDTGTLACSGDCLSFDLTGCPELPQDPVCGDGLINGDDECDGTDLNSQTCGSMGFYTGTLSCSESCIIVTSACTKCGNDEIDSGETCDGTDLNDTVCEDHDYTLGGTLACAANCDAFDFSSCLSNTMCGDGTIESPEVCEAGKLNGQTCELQGKGPGTLVCGTDCKSFDLSECTEIEEQSDTPSTPDDSSTPNTSSNDSTDNETDSDACGNWVLDVGEECDGTNLNSQTCEKKDYDGGLLKCKSTCKFDYSGCTNEDVTEDDASEIIQEASNQIEAAKAQNRDTNEAEALLVEALDAYNADDPDYDLAKSKASSAISSIGDLIVSQGDGPVGMVQLGIIIIVLIVILVAVVMIKKRVKAPTEEEAPSETSAPQEPVEETQNKESTREETPVETEEESEDEYEGPIE